MTFTANGYLAPGLHSMTVAEIEAALVTAFPHSTTRRQILAGYRKHLAEVQAIIPTFAQFLNGSFATNKNDPSDANLVVFMDGVTVDNLPQASKDKLRLLLSGPVTKSTHMCDAYFCPVYPPNHPSNNFSRSQRKYWMGEFGYDRQDVPKGIVTVSIIPPPPPAAPASPAPSVPSP